MPIDPRLHYVSGVDFAADETGATAPTTFEQAAVLAAALDAIGIRRPAALVGGSYGGMVGLALAQAEPRRVDRLVLVSVAAEPHPASTAARELQRRVVALGLLSGQHDEALSIARGMAMLTYRSPSEFQQRFTGGMDGPAALCGSDCGDYLRARGEAFRSVMSPQMLSQSVRVDRPAQVDPRAKCSPGWYPEIAQRRPGEHARCGREAVLQLSSLRLRTRGLRGSGAWRGAEKGRIGDICAAGMSCAFGQRAVTGIILLYALYVWCVTYMRLDWRIL